MGFRYEVNGQVVEFKKEPTQADIDEAASQISTTTQDPFLPGQAKTEQKIAQREDLFTKGIERAKGIPTVAQERGIGPAIGQAAIAGLETIGGGFQRAESAVANPLMELQEAGREKGFLPTQEELTLMGTPTESAQETLEEAKSNRLNFAKSLGITAVEGLKGERVGELGDIPRRAGVPEPVSATIGLLSGIGLVDKLLFGSVLSGIKNMEKGVGNLIKGNVPFKAGTDVTLRAADDIIRGAKEIRTSLGNAVGTTVKNVVGKVEQSKLGEIISSLPETAIRKMKDNIYGLKFFDEGKTILDNSLDNVWKFRQFLDDFLTDRDFIMATKKAKSVIKGARTATKGAMETVDNSIKPVMDKYSKFIKIFNKARKTVVDPDTGIILEKKLRNIFKKGAERGTQKLFIDLIEFMPDAEDLIKTIVRFNRREVVGRATKRVARTAATIGLLRGAFRNLGGSSDVGGSIPTQAK